ncbi:RICIN domain-containing protein [Pseudokineococcus basanitobsidens]|uniref:RICIN domain-containing protein n=1 Tax=Pseudokineococcus basanitobsidens TaxID=1926649 RepID=A0ABU8RHX3_9ACTN
MSRPGRWPGPLAVVRAAQASADPRPGTPADRRDGGAALVLVLVVMMLGASLALLALTAVTSQVRPTAVERKHVRALHASEAGTQVALSMLQSATTPDPLVAGSVVGDRSLLPCPGGGTAASGAVGGQPGDYTYAVTVRYFLADPEDMTTTQRTAAAMPCPLAAVPQYALITSTGAAPAAGGVGAGEADRTTELVYSFRTGTTNVVGGTLASGSTCWQADAAAPGAAIRMATCSATSPLQKFSWRDDLTLVLAPSVTTAPLCVTADRAAGAGSATLPASLALCDGLLHQSWGVSDGRIFYGYPDGVGGASRQLCAASGLLQASSSCGTAFTIAQAVGSGRAGSVSASQPDRVIHWVSYAEYGRCLDVNSWRITNDLILFPCKQDPRTGELRWNQGWLYGAPDAAGRSEMSTYYGSTNEDYASARARGVPRVCLDGAAATGTALQLRTCSGAPSQRLVVNREVTAADGTVDYARSYTIVDSTGRCLDVGPQTAASAGNVGTTEWSSVRWSACTGGSAQKWNAPPSFTPSSQTGFREDS